MKAGDLVKVKNSTDDDNPEMVRLYQERSPCLLIEIIIGGHWTYVLDGDNHRSIPTHRLEVISESR
jgi:hypothetical protein